MSWHEEELVVETTFTISGPERLPSFQQPLMKVMVRNLRVTEISLTDFGKFGETLSGRELDQLARDILGVACRICEQVEKK